MAQVVEWELGGKVREFRLTMRALAKLEREAHLKTFMELLIDAEGNPSTIRMSAELTAVILWCGLLWKEPDVSREQVEDWVDGGNLHDAMMTATAIYGQALETFAQVPPVAAPPTGTGTPPAATPSPSA